MDVPVFKEGAVKMSIITKKAKTVSKESYLKVAIAERLQAYEGTISEKDLAELVTKVKEDQQFWRLLDSLLDGYVATHMKNR